MNALERVGIRPRIVGGSLLIAILISVIAGIVIESQVERIVREGTVEVLRSDAAPYVAALTSEPDESLDPPGAGRYVAVIDADGDLVLDSLPEGLDVTLDEAVAETGSQRHAGPDGDYLIVAVDVEVRGEEWHVIAARSARAEDAVLGQMRVLVFSGLGLVDLGVGVAALLLTTASLRPVNRLRRSAEELSGDADGELLPVGPADDEIARLASTLNGLIVRLRDSAARERQLVADASHELRTPAALLRTRLELAQRDGATVDELRRDLADAERSAVRLGELISSMLALSTLEAGPGSETSSVGEVIDDVEAAVDRGRFRARQTSVEVEFLDSSAEVSGSIAVSAADVGRVVDNLIGNALTAVGESGTVSVAVAAGHDRLRLEVTDTGGGMDEEFVPRAFDRFARGAGSGSQPGGAGLGLPIVAAIVHRAGGVVRVQNSVGVGLTVVVELPIVP